jgi:hypothetical protein
MATAPVQVREVTPGLWSCYWTDGKGVLQAVVQGVKPTARVAVEDGKHVMRDQNGKELARQSKDRDDSEFDDHFHWGDL